MNKFLSDLAASISPYVPGEQPKGRQFIKLNTNENPYPPSPILADVLRETNIDSFRLYPPPECDDLRDAIAQYYGVTDKNVYVANGSDELLAWCYPAFFVGKKPILINDITYSFYKVYAALFGVKTEIIPLTETFDIPIAEYGRENGGIIIANPNAPTGRILYTDQLEFIIKSNPDQVVLIDEAYIDFGGKSAIDLTRRYKNVLVVQTFSKSRSLAGLRCGFAIGSVELMDGLARIKNSINSYTMDSINLKLAKAAIKDTEYFHKTVNVVMNTRERVSGDLKHLGFNFGESFSNFLFVTHPKIKAADLYQKLYDSGILVRHFNQPRIDNYLRITVGTDEQMDILIKRLKTWL